MRITESQLRQVIREELLREAAEGFIELDGKNLAKILKKGAKYEINGMDGTWTFVDWLISKAGEDAKSGLGIMSKFFGAAKGDLGGGAYQNYLKFKNDEGETKTFLRGTQGRGASSPMSPSDTGLTTQS